MTNDKSAEEIVRGLRGCIDSLGCEKCSAFGRCNGTFASLCDVAAAKITELNDFETSQCAKLLERVAELEGKLDRAQIEYDYKQNECNHHYGKSMEWKYECDELKAQLSASQQETRAAVCVEQTTNRGMDISGEYDVDANLLCPKCGAVVGDAEYRELNGPYCHKCGQRLAIGPQEESFISRTIDGVETAVILRRGPQEAGE